MQRIIGASGILGLIAFAFLFEGSPLVIRYLKSTNVREGYALGGVLLLQAGLALLMFIVGIAWIFILPKGSYKYKRLIVGLYLTPFVIEVCFWGWAVLVGLYWSIKLR